MIDLNLVRKTIEGRIATQMAIAPVYPVFYGNQTTKSPNNATWLWCTVNFGDTEYQFLEAGESTNGVAQINIFTPVASGTGLSLTIVNRVISVFNRLTVSGVRFRPASGPRSVNQAETSAWYQVSVSIQFKAEG